MTYSSEHKIYPVDPGILFYEIDTVTVRNPLTFDQLSEMLHIPYEEVRFLNPSFKQGVIPATPETPFKLRLRKKYIGDFINNETALYAYRTKAGITRDSMMALALNNNRETIEYRVKKGETISSIAKKFHMSVAELKSLNGLKKNYVKPKQSLLVYTGPGKSAFPESLSQNTQPLPDSSTKRDKEILPVAPADPVYHVVRSGESLGRIAQKYGCTVDNLMTWNNLKSQTILVGQKLKILSSSGASASKPVSRESGSTGKTTRPNAPKFTWYTVQQGDNLWEIAEKYDVTVAEIKKLNNITNAHRVKAGQKIKIPRGN
jgi:membrane-bound lytic murein transglycosylase D